MKSIKFIVIALLIFISSINLNALDTRGKDFWFNFMPNFHNQSGGGSTELTDSLLIFIAAEAVTNCIIEYTDNTGKKSSTNFTITNPKQVYTFKLYWKPYELIGFNNMINIDKLNQDEQIAPQSFHVTTDQNISLIGHSKASLTNDAFLVFPTTALGKEYYILSYNSNGFSTGFNGQITASSTPSQFSITAVEDNTKIEISPRVKTARNGISKQVVTLNKGQSYLVQAKIEEGNLNGDLTGTYVKSDKPIAVFAGQQRATLPVKAGGTSRDILVEQMVPINFWGRNAYIVPFKVIPGITPLGTDLFRILAAFDSTDVYLNDELVATLNAGEFYEGALDQILQLESSGPILVAEYKKTSIAGGNTDLYGDPFMVIVPPKEQFSRIYRCINAQVYDKDQFGNVSASFIEQYVTLVAPDKALASVKIDGVPVQQSSFSKIWKSGYSVTTAKVKDGTHDITCDEEVGIFVYGYGPANSYGYIGGMSSKNIDFNPPKALVKQDCDGYSIFSLDTNIFDSGIDQIVTPDSLNYNIVYNVPSHKDTSAFTFTAKVIDKYKDSKMTVIIKDSIGYSKKIVREMKGFTVSIKNLSDTLKISDSLSAKAIKCYNFELFNYGKYTQTFDLKFALGNTKMTLSESGNITLVKGASKIIKVCYDPLNTVFAIDSILIKDTCISRMLATINLVTIGDSIPPVVSLFNDPCSNTHTIEITDSSKFDTGIKSVNIINKTNCEINFDLSTLEHYKMNISVTNPNLEAYYLINVIDVWGNSRTLTDTIRGFTLGFEFAKTDTTKSLNFKDRVIGGVYCDTLRLINYGSLETKIDSVKLLHNIEFSVPQSQFPLVIPGNSSKTLEVCYNPLRYLKNKIYTDSLIFEYNCQTKYIKLQGKPLEFVMESSNKCGQVTKLSSSYQPSQFGFNSLSPNPSGGLINLNFETSKSENISLEIYDALGNRKLIFNLNVANNGIYEVEIDANELRNGIYYCLLSNGDKTHLKNLIINK